MEPEIHLAKTLIILLDHENGQTRFSKPKEGPYEGNYSVYQKDNGEAIIRFNQGPQGKNFPVYLQFQANLPIMAVGFAECGGVPKCTVRGCCGGCFYLQSDFGQDREDLAISPLIRNFGVNPWRGYRFKIWLKRKDGFEQEIEIDPRIYNEGDTGPIGCILGPFLWLWRRLWS